MHPNPCVIITCSSQGLGFALTELFLKSSSLTVIGCSRKHSTKIKHLEKKYPQRFYFLRGDITQQPFIQSIFNFIKKQTLYPEVLINNAGLLIKEPFLKARQSSAERMYAVNVLAPMVLIQSALKARPQNKALHIINIASMGGLQGSVKFAGLSLYASTKAALITLSECIAEECKNVPVRCNVIALGATQTEMFSKAFPQFKAPVLPEQIAQWIFQFAIAEPVINGKIIPLALSNP